MEKKNGKEFYGKGSELVGKDAVTISMALIDAYYEGKECGYDEAKENYKRGW